jgi:hypothetical protein
MSAARRRAGEALSGWAPLCAVALILFNDFWLKPRHPGFCSGKLSDVGIAFLLPLFIVAAWEWGRAALGRLVGRPFLPAGRAVTLGACILATLYYACMELWPAFGRFHAAWLETLCPWFHFRAGTADPTDLGALLVLPLAWLWLTRRGSAPPPRGRSCAPPPP